MNVFVLDLNPELAAKYHCDKHVVKMILESAQMLSTAHHELGSHNGAMYKPTHVNHPCNVWCRKSTSNYGWLFDLFIELIREYRRRYQKDHGCQKLIPYLAEIPNCELTSLTEFALAMPEEFKSNDAVQSYRQYYWSKLADIKMSWRPPSSIPNWILDYV